MARPFTLSSFSYAHRGIWLSGTLPENSLGAFRTAAHQGIGIELDLRPSSDGEIMIFHDSLLDRLTEASGVFEQHTCEDLKALWIEGSGERIPAFEDLLQFWPTDQPMLCELKIDGTTDPEAFARKVAARLADWPGRAAVMSFSEAAVRALPDTLMRGQLVLPSIQAGESRFDRTVRLAIRDGIDYLAVHHTDIARVSELADRPVAVWTVHSEAALAAVQPYNPAIIFEHIDPAGVRP